MYKLEPCALWVGLYNGATIMEKGMAVLYGLNCVLTKFICGTHNPQNHGLRQGL